MYNFRSAHQCWPYWDGIYYRVAGVIGLTTESQIIAEKMFTLGLKDILMPAYIPNANDNAIGNIAFILIWTVLPYMYIVYFTILYVYSKKTPGAKIQQALCIFSIFHFLFFTDLVDYRFGRRIIFPYSEWFHWLEKFVWRIAIFLPIYQKFQTKELKTGHGVIGQFLHYALPIWAVVFFVYQILIYDTYRFYCFAFRGGPTPELLKMSSIYSQALGYHGMLVILTIIYGILALRSRNYIAIST